MEELEKTAKELILAITEKTLKSLKDNGFLKEPSKLQMLCSSPEMTSLIKKLSTSKYDPNRKFRERDKVRVKREVHGRPVYIGEDAWYPLDPNEIWEVVEEKETGWVHLKNDCRSADVWHAMLELVTPVEARVSFRVGDSPVDGEWSVWKDSLGKTEIISSYKIATHPHAKEAAEAERDRLNEEWRKEQDND